MTNFQNNGRAPQTPSAPPRQRSRQPPEHERYNELKGKRVLVAFADDSTLRGTLRWVDRYTLGVWREGTDLAPAQVWIVYKQHVMTVGEAF